MSLAEKRKAALASLSEESRLLLMDWLQAESKAYGDGTYDMPSYTHAECGAEHALDGIISNLDEGA